MVQFFYQIIFANNASHKTNIFCVVQMLLVIRDKSTEQPLRAENQVGVGLPSDKQTIKTLEEAPEGAPLNVIVRAPSSETLEVSWKVKFLHSHANTVPQYQQHF